MLRTAKCSADAGDIDYNGTVKHYMPYTLRHGEESAFNMQE